MAGISNINSSAGISSDKTAKKLTFEIGETFEGKAESIDNENGEVVLKTKEGWKFAAKLENPAELSKNGFNNFVVQGFENGKLIIKLLPAKNNNNTSEDSLTTILKQYSGSGSEEDINLLKVLIEHEIPLTKENISDVKTVIEFRKSIIDNPAKEDEFISNYLSSKGIDENSEKGIQLKASLKDFFANLKEIGLDEIAVFKENNLELTGDNIKSFNSIFKSDALIYKNLKEISNIISMGNTENTSVNNTSGSDEYSAQTTMNTDNNGAQGKIQENNQNDKAAANVIGKSDENVITAKAGQNAETKEDVNQKELSDEVLNKLNNIVSDETEASEKGFRPSIKTISQFKNSVLINEARTNEFIKVYLNSSGILGSSIKGKTLAADLSNFFSELKEFNSTEIQNILQNGSEAKGFGFGNIKEFIRENPTAFNEFKKIIGDLEKSNEASSNKLQIEGKDTANSIGLLKSEVDNKNTGSIADKNTPFIKFGNTNLGEYVHDEIDSKINEMKSIISKIVKENNINSPVFEKVMSAVNNNINDFKIFNSISNEYYYVDVPVNFQTNEYNCKLIVKDDRKSGKKLDSKNIKIAASVNTVNMGIVDAFINVKNNFVNVDIKAETKFTRILEASKTKLLSKLAEKDYIVNLDIKEKANDEKLDLVSCRKFFNDDNIISIDTRV